MAEIQQLEEANILDNKPKPKLFGKWAYDQVTITDNCFIDYIAVKSSKSQVYIPHTSGRWQKKSFRKASCPIVERLVGALMFHGRNSGKKAKGIRIVRQAFEIIHLMTGQNPLQVFIQAVINTGPREDSARTGSGGVVRKQAVDVSPLRRVNLGIYFMAKGAREHAIKQIKSIAECLADEIMHAAKANAQASWAIKKKDDIEKTAKTNR